MVGELRTLVHTQPIALVFFRLFSSVYRKKVKFEKKKRNRRSSKQAISNFDALTILQVFTFSFDAPTIFSMFKYAFDALLCHRQNDHQDQNRGILNSVSITSSSREIPLSPAI